MARIASIVFQIIWCLAMIPGMLFAVFFAEMAPEALIGYEGRFDLFWAVTTMMRIAGWLLFLSIPLAAIEPFFLRRKKKIGMSLWVQVIPFVIFGVCQMLNIWQARVWR